MKSRLPRKLDKLTAHAFMKSLILTMIVFLSSSFASSKEAHAQSRNLLVNPGAELGLEPKDGKMVPVGWTVGGAPEPLPHVDPNTDVPRPRSHSGDHRFGVSIGWQAAELYQYQEVSVKPGREYIAGMWCTHANGTDESILLSWCEAPFGSEEKRIAQTAPAAENQWTHYGGLFTPTTGRIALIIRYRHLAPTDIASCHVDDIYLYESPAPANAPDLPSSNKALTSAEHKETKVSDAGVHREVWEIRNGNTEYKINVGGTMDEFNTHQYSAPDRSGYICLYQPNVSWEIENIGDTLVYSPRVIINGRRNWYTQEDLTREIFRNSPSDEKKAFALWNWCRSNIWNGTTYGPPLWENRSMVLFMNSFGTGACGTYHTVMPHLGIWGGLETYGGCQANCSHATQKERYGGRFRYFDCMLNHGGGQPQGYFCLALDNQTVVGTEEIAQDHYISNRVGSSAGFYGNTALFGGPGERYSKVDPWSDPNTMFYTLRPGEKIRHTWIQDRLLWNGEDPKPGNKSNANGTLRYQPRLTRPGVIQAAENYNNLKFDSRDGKAVLAANSSGAAVVTWKIHSPWTLVGAVCSGQFEIPADGAATQAELAISFDGQKWETLWTGDKTGNQKPSTDLSNRAEFRDPILTHDLYVRVALHSDGNNSSELWGLTIEGIFQTYVPSLPALSAGENTVTYADESAERVVRITQEWIPSEDVPVPSAPAAPVLPVAGGSAGFNTMFKWEPSQSPAETPISQYEFFLSPRQDLAWPLLSCFHYIIQNPTPEFKPTAPDAFIDGRTYYWRVRACNNKGLWGPWSETWSFTARGPGQPTAARIVTNVMDGAAYLEWQPPASGAPVAHYEIYSCSQTGFTPLREAITVYGGMDSKFVKTLAANLAGQTPALRFDLIEVPGAFCRIVAVDGEGNRGVPTSCLEAPHPLLLPMKRMDAVVRQPFYGKLPCRLNGGQDYFLLKGGIQTLNADKPIFTLKEAPGWLTIDADTGRVNGTPPEVGPYSFTASVDDGSGRTSEQTYLINAQAQTGAMHAR